MTSQTTTRIVCVRVPQYQHLPLGTPAPPPALETEDYYGGWRNRPRLVARSNYPEETWSGLCNNWYHITSYHPFIDLWSSSDEILQREIKSVLSDTGTKWKDFEPLRIGSGRQEKDVKLLITVEAGSTSWYHAWSAARWCKEVIRNYGIEDVEVEVQECLGCWVVMKIRESLAPGVMVKDCPICT
ncbi:riboflavin transporter MCH5 [Fusarium beomiforme]|uniref:Riboflavin transporter MCH5 n=1 Tax=Fusarium beomiforme TaxID=44412 RepID=A0A9P5AJ11_9HYPO|nr:riboflavin transporter MCH5 [Fusarium beomiforme]